MKTKRKNRIKKATTKKPEQIGVCRFIDLRTLSTRKLTGITRTTLFLLFGKGYK